MRRSLHVHRIAILTQHHAVLRPRRLPADHAVAHIQPHRFDRSPVRVAQAAASPHHIAELAPLDTRGRLSVLSRLRYPPIRAPAELTLATAACPFATLVAFVQGHLARSDFVLPPEPRR